MEVMRSVNNYFIDASLIGEFTIEAGALINVELLVGSYIMIEGSALNDDVYKVGEDIGLIDEVFTGTIHKLKVPRDFIRLVDEIKAFNDSVPVGVASESYDGFSQSFLSGDNANWTISFKSKLNRFRRMYDERTRQI